MDDSNDRVRENTSRAVNDGIDQETLDRVEALSAAGRPELSARIDELDREWDIERTLQTNASVLALSGLALGIAVSKKWLLVPGVVLPFLLQHAVQGWCPPLPIMRRLGFRTRKEIDREKYALKVLRGDFAEACTDDNRLSAERAYEAAG